MNYKRQFILQREMIAVKSLESGALQIDYFKQKNFKLKPNLLHPTRLKIFALLLRLWNC